MHEVIKILLGEPVQVAIVLIIPGVLKQLRLWHIDYLSQSLTAKINITGGVKPPPYMFIIYFIKGVSSNELYYNNNGYHSYFTSPTIY